MIVVTGGAGFLGTHLCEALIAQGNRVVCIDDLSSGKRQTKLEYQNAWFTFINRDVLLPFDMEGVKQVFNLACPASPVQYQRDPVKTLRTNVWGTYNFLELARKNAATFLQASTSEVYGDPLVHPQTEQYNGNVSPIGPRACYDEGKRAAEALCFDYRRQYGVEAKVARIFNTYGPGMARDDGRVVSNFVAAALEERDLMVLGNGKQTRSFCYVDDLITALVSLMDGSYSGLSPVNLGNPEEVTVLELAQMVLEIVKPRRSQIVFDRERSDDPWRRKPDIALAKKQLGWEPKVSLKDGLRRTVEYFKGER